MTHCAKCGAELIGTRKFCTACGAPAGDLRAPAPSPAASTGMSPAVPSVSAPIAPSIQYAPSPASAVNPFAQTAGPNSLPVLNAPDNYGPPPSSGSASSLPPELASTTPGVGDPSRAPQVSPLAVSNVDSNRGAQVDQMVASARAARAAQLAADKVPDSAQTAGGTKRGIPGTQLMPSMANPPVAPTPPKVPSTPPAPAKRPDKTQLLGAMPMPPALRAVANASAPAAPTPSAPGIASASQSGPHPADAEASGSHASQGSQPGVPLPRAPSYPDPSSSQPGVPLPQGLYPPQPPAQAPQPPPGWNPAPYQPPAPAYQPPVAPAPPAYPGYGGYGFAPGTRVNVTWSNGQRYPGTVQQVAGSQCLVVFPDGQHHWVDLQYVSPG